MGNRIKKFMCFTFLIAYIFLGANIDLQAQTVSGTVINSASLVPIPGVNISLKANPIIGTATDGEGNFSLEVTSLNDTLVVSFIGFRTEEVPIQGRTNIEIALESQTISGEELVVTAFGVQRQERSLSYSTQGVDTDVLTTARELNPINSLQGKVSGLSISQSGAGVGSGSRVNLRGNRSISGGNEPLYVVDGVPISGSFNELSPDNIASINVLKGANAAALYGSEAQNGVIIIETIKGSRNQVQVTWNTNAQMAQAVHNVEFQNQFGQGVSGVYSPSSEESWGPPLDGRLVDHWSPDPELTGQQYSFEPRPDNVDKFFNDAYNLSSGLTASIGAENTTTTFSYSRTDATGITPNNSLARNNATIRVNSDLTDWVTLDAKLDYMNQDLDNPVNTGDSDDFNPFRNTYMLPRNIPYGQYKQDEYVGSDGLKRQNFWNPGSTSGKNPFWAMENMLRLQSSERVLGLASLLFDLRKGLTLLTRTSIDASNSSQETKVSFDSYGSAYANGLYGFSKSSSRSINSDFLLTYVDNLAEQWNVNFKLGGSIKKNVGGRNGTLSANTTQQLLVPNFFTLSNTQFPAASYSPAAETETQSLYFASTIGWQDVIYLDLTGRNDWSSTLPAESRSYFYPSIGFSAIVSDLITVPDYLAFARFRASWAKVGSAALPQLLSRTANFSAGGNAGFLQISSVLPNENLEPEETESTEVGLDLRFFNNRLGFDITAYKTNTFNQLFTISLPTGSGAASFFTNGGDVENKGLEIRINTTPVQTGTINWDIDLNWSTNENTVKSISDERPQVIIGGDTYMRDFVVEQDEEFGNIYSRGWVRDTEGRVIVDSNGLPEITGGKTVKVANPNPDWTGGITSSFNYKNISASFVIDHRQGGSIVSMTNSVMFGNGVAKETARGRDGGLVFGDNLFSQETAVNQDGSPNDIEINAQDFWRNVGGRNTPVGEAFVDEATNTRLREITIGYMLPQSVIEQLPVSNIQFSLVGRNLFFIYRKGNWDPDILTGTDTSSLGFNSFTRPTKRTFGANLKIEF